MTTIEQIEEQIRGLDTVSKRLISITNKVATQTERDLLNISKTLLSMNNSSYKLIIKILNENNTL